MNLGELPFFKNMTDDEIREISSLSVHRYASFEKNRTILSAGETTEELGVVLQGSVRIENIDVWGNRSILNKIFRGQVFGEVYAISKETLMVDAIAEEACEIVFINTVKLTDPSHARFSWYSKVLLSFLQISVSKNLALSERIFHTSSKRVRTRIQSYLSSCALRNGSDTFTIPYDRQQLADYLNLDRSALSKELSRMQEEGLLQYHKNQFTLFEQ